MTVAASILMTVVSSLANFGTSPSWPEVTPSAISSSASTPDVQPSMSSRPCPEPGSATLRLSPQQAQACVNFVVYTPRWPPHIGSLVRRTLLRVGEPVDGLTTSVVLRFRLQPDGALLQVRSTSVADVVSPPHEQSGDDTRLVAFLGGTRVEIVAPGRDQGWRRNVERSLVPVR